MIPDVYTVLQDHAPRSRIAHVALSILREKLLRAATIDRLRQSHANKDAITLSDLITDTINYKATDPRDRVYAVLSLVTHGFTLEPNYHWSISKAYTTALKSILQQDGDLRSFCWLQGGIESRDKGLPSWVPDLVAERSLVTISQAFDKRIGLVYSASSPNGKFSDVPMTFEEETVLVLEGVAIDAVECLGDAAPNMRTAKLLGLPHSLKQTLQDGVSS